MEHPLLEIQQTVMQYAEVIAKVTGVDVEVVDDRLFRVAGTGIYSGAVNTDMSSQGHVYRHVLSTGQRQVIDDPGNDPLCQDCSERHNCRESFEISTPIKMGESIIGVIGMIGSESEQKQLLMGNLQVYIDFIDQIAEFIAVKARESDENARQLALLDTLDRVINSMSQCVLILGRDRRVSQINRSALTQLRQDQSCVGSVAEVTATGDTVGGQNEYRLSLSGREYMLFGELHTIKARNDSYRELLLFRTSKDLQSQIYTMISTVHSGNIVGDSPATRKLREEIGKVARSSSTVLITGESGTGKEIAATAIWKAGDRADRRFVALNCAAIPEPLLESELFGYVKGAFTGADPNGRIGKFELANKGVIFLDEIGDMPLYLQAKLLRVLQERTVIRIGSNQLLSVDVKVIAATNKDLRRMIEEKTFREDLYYRLNVIPLHIAPLRERKEDIQLLLGHFVERYAERFGKRFCRIAPAAERKLLDYSWPGNVRELENAVEFMVNMMEEDGVLSAATLPRSIADSTVTVQPSNMSGEVTPLAVLEQREIANALALYGSDLRGKQRAAASLGISVATLYRKLGKAD